MRNLLAAVVFAIGLLFSSQAFAQTGDYKAPAVGTEYTYQYSNGTQLITQVASVSGLMTKFTSDKGYRDVYAGFVSLQTSRGETVSFDQSKIDGLWPLKVGNSVEFALTYGFGTSKNVIRVTGYERVAVPAGTFDAFVVEWAEDSVGGSFHGTYKYWFVPGVGTVQYKMRTPDLSYNQFLVSVKPGVPRHASGVP